ncbi:hypothetical protein, partial [Paenibacillus xylanexedens]|uniref:hypothetical protein n=1 Tax=Paenibacillus xylanexedens TaxID=528191 RepID=UPI001C9305DA
LTHQPNHRTFRQPDSSTQPSHIPSTRLINPTIAHSVSSTHQPNHRTFRQPDSSTQPSHILSAQLINPTIAHSVSSTHQHDLLPTQVLTEQRFLAAIAFFFRVNISNDHEKPYLARIHPCYFLTISGKLISIIYYKKEIFSSILAQISSLGIVRISNDSESCK